MKKILMFLLLFFINIPFVNAYGPYNYEISEMKLNGTIVSVKGWARMNGGTCTGGKSWDSDGDPNCTAKYNPNRRWDNYGEAYGSGIGSTVKSQDGSTVGLNYATVIDEDYTQNTTCKSVKSDGIDRTYKYELYVDKILEDGNKVNKIKIEMDPNEPKRPMIDLSFSSCPKSNSSNCSRAWSYRSACYLDVGFYFEFDMNDLESGEYGLRLKIISGWNSDISESFYMGIYGDKYDSSLSEYVDETTVQTKIKLVSNLPNFWDNAGYGNRKLFNNGVLKRGSIYPVQAKQVINNETWYKTSTSSLTGWVPASWVEPATSTFLKLKIGEDELEELNDCAISTQEAQPENFSINACSTSKITIDRNTTNSVCNHASTNYYSSSCSEKIDVQYIPNYGDSLLKHSTIDYSIKIDAYKGCSYYFNYDFWNEKYNYYITELNKPNNSDARISLIQEYIQDLEGYITSYNSLINKNYNFEPRATIVLSSPNANLVSFNFQKINYTTHNNNITNTTGTCRELANGTNICDYSFGIDSLNNALRFGGNFYLPNQYLLKEAGKFDLNVSVTNLGERGIWSVSGACSLDIIDRKMIYRTVDDTEPFDFRESIEESCNVRSNWCNNKYNFKEIISEEIWKEKPKYEFHISSKNIKNIRKNNETSGVSAYSGKGCTRKSNGEYYCEFLRNSLYFSHFYIDDGI